MSKKMEMLFIPKQNMLTFKTLFQGKQQKKNNFDY